MIPLVRFASSHRLMGDLALGRRWKAPVWAAVFLIVGFNVILVLQVFHVVPE